MSFLSNPSLSKSIFIKSMYFTEYQIKIASYFYRALLGTLKQ
ncbi:hypothetical protein PLIP_b0732 [Pseudoalteromonas lipolytica LMEB 39]|nr:hypothetical protein [Pseudoalteromonas lipolytica LMEB 39]